jgi:AraC-like DNA-binding protein
MPDLLYPNPYVRILMCVRQRLNNWNYANHSAPFWRFYWNPLPDAYVILHGRETYLSPDTCYALPPNTPFGSRNTRETEQFYMHFLARAPYDTVEPGVYAFPLTGTIRQAIDFLSSSFHRSAPRAARAQAGVWAHLLACLSLGAVPEEKLGLVYTDPRIARAIDRIEETVELGNEELAGEASMNVNAFIRLFKEQTGVTPQSYIQKKKIEKACVLLHFTDKTIDEIADKTGFCDRYHFSRVFRRQRGLGPAAFRKIRA